MDKMGVSYKHDSQALAASTERETDMIFEVNGISTEITSDEHTATCVIKIDDTEIYNETRQHFDGKEFNAFRFFNENLWQFCANPDNDYHQRIWVNTALFHAAVYYRAVFFSDADYREHLDEVNQLRHNIFETWACPVNQ
jgi:hypothetical protein